MTRLFEGREAEGMFRGLMTLFVAGEVTYTQITDEFKATVHRQIYFGADGCSKIKWSAVRACIDNLPCIATAEVAETVPRDLALAPEFFVIIPVDTALLDLQAVLDSVDEMRDRVQLKFNTNQRSYLFPLTSTKYNNRSDIEHDKELWK
jgi:hypothetical protein